MNKPIMCDPKLLDKDLSGKVYIITGSNTGIGFVTAQQLAKQGSTVILACRNTKKAEVAAEAIKHVVPAAVLIPMELDLADLSSVHRFVEQFLSMFSNLHGLINNAGVMNTSLQRTKDGFEYQFGINHCGHFLLTHLLLDVLKKSAPAKILCVSSCFHDRALNKQGTIDFEDLNFHKKKYNGWISYAQSKLANVLHAKELAIQLEGTGVTAVSLHPGWIRTDLIRYTIPIWVQSVLYHILFKRVGMLDPWEGTQTTLHCLLDDSVCEHSGAYYSQVGMYSKKECNPGGWPLVSPNPEVQDPNISKKLWEESKKLVKISN